jgi:hypothetical protein
MIYTVFHRASNVSSDFKHATLARVLGKMLSREAADRHLFRLEKDWVARKLHWTVNLPLSQLIQG